MNFKKSIGGRGLNYLVIPGDVNGEELCVSSPIPSDCCDAEEEEFLKQCKKEVEELRNSLDFI